MKKFLLPYGKGTVTLQLPDKRIRAVLESHPCAPSSSGSQNDLIDKFGEDLVRQERIVIHDCDDTSQLVSLGTLPSGGELIINRLAAEADLLCAEGFIEPHFFAGFSGGRKSVLPGCPMVRS